MTQSQDGADCLSGFRNGPKQEHLAAPHKSQKHPTSSDHCDQRFGKSLSLSTPDAA